MPPFSELQPITEAILNVRNWEEDNLPLEQSALAYDLLTLASHHTISGTPLSLKQLFLLLEYSEAGVRKQLRRCIKEGWLKLVGSKKDKRVRVVIAEPKLLQALSDYAELLKHSYRE
jgi:hypothetical protein